MKKRWDFIERILLKYEVENMRERKVSKKVLAIGMVLILVAMVFAALPMNAGAGSSSESVSTRPIEDFVDAQNPHWGFKYLMWGTNSWDREAYVDYAGIDNQAIIAAGGDDLGTTFSGTITEKVLKDGNTLVHVTLFTKNALTYANDYTMGGETVYGSTPDEVIAGGHASLGSSKFSLTYITDQAPGAPMPDLLDMVIFGIKGTYPTKVNFVASSKGELNSEYGVPQGTPGKVTVVMGINLASPGVWNNHNGWPVSTVDVQQIGN
jgi:hypothetical protein